MTAFTAWLREPNPTSRLQARMGQAWLSWLRMRRNPLAMMGLTIVLALIVMAALAPWIATHDPFAQDLSRRLLPPVFCHNSRLSERDSGFDL